MLTKSEDYYYNATAYLGVRQKDTLSLSCLDQILVTQPTEKNYQKILGKLVLEPLFLKTQQTKRI